jgi:hypothetical protein
VAAGSTVTVGFTATTANPNTSPISVTCT